MTFVPYECDRCGFTLYIESVHEMTAHDKAHDKGYTFESVEKHYYDELIGWRTAKFIKAIPPKKQVGALTTA